MTLSAKSIQWLFLRKEKCNLVFYLSPHFNFHPHLHSLHFLQWVCEQETSKPFLKGVEFLPIFKKNVNIKFFTPKYGKFPLTFSFI